MIVLGIDPSSTRTGLCLIEEMGEGRLPRLSVSSFSCSDPANRTYADTCRRMSDHLYDYLMGLRSRGVRVDVAGLEPPIITMGTRREEVTDLTGTHEVERPMTNAHTLQLLASLSGTVVDILHRFKIRAELAPVDTWRKFCIGRAKAPPGTPKEERNGWGKRQTHRWAVDLGLRCQFTVKNKDQADAVGIAVWTAVHHADSMDVRRMLANRKAAA